MDYAERQRQLRQERAEVVRILRSQGATLRSIATQVGVAPSTVVDDLRREDSHDDD